MSEPDKDTKKRGRRLGLTGFVLAGIGAGMLGLAFAAVPLYRMFCQATSYTGEPRRAAKAPDRVLDRMIRVRFDANVDSSLPWTFTPDQNYIDVKIGETALAFFKATNKTATPITGRAVFNVSPEASGRYFTKIECFCFKEQTLAPHASVEMPVTFFVDPKIVDDEDTNTITEITLSYTFYRADSGSSAATTSPGASSGS
jgi:cytochrome c oxidase assembly protein subunit 11